MKFKFGLLMVCLILSYGLSGNASAQTPVPPDFGAKGALQDSSITLEEALVYAIQDEYLAQARYDAIIGKFGNVRTFTNIKAAEQRHISALVNLFQKYNIKIPDNNASQYVTAPETLKDAYKQGVDGEIENIAMYDKLKGIPSLPEDVKAVFTQLGNASKNHLEAFRRGLGRGH
ncbi:ferritin-like domain-containing protein [Mesobacillus subterraneus]|uniref:DUF2202 domain-containing protein n=1 Tax=Mesobacillus subterraneus TaxID=285983 RepID=A0A427TWJ1_9BACI|nr:DUF2202 domain-containing protein [Mesobacillus subterraneus]RSD28720.1 DUF2202 domain-containing protein [Mesobacillus subterraneus]